MLKVKLARFGRRNQPHYRIVVNEARDKRDGNYVDLLGHYAPTQQPKLLEIDLVKYKEWLVKGAQPTLTVASLVARFESKNPFPAKKPTLSKKAKAKLAEKANQDAQPKPEPTEVKAEVEAESTPEATEVKTEAEAKSETETKPESTENKDEVEAKSAETK